jgi:hypothetical protein
LVAPHRLWATAASAKATHFHRDGVEARKRLDAVAVFA